MRITSLLFCGTAALGLAGCGSGDINISPSTSVGDTTINNPPASGGPAANPCASYTNTGGQTIQGSPSGDNCVYSPAFVDSGNNLLSDLFIPALPNGGAHIFQGSLFVGNTYRSDAAMAAAGIAQGGDGPELSIEAGTTIAFEDNSSFLVINRGARIFAVGRADAPITITCTADLVGDLDNDPERVECWGGMVVNGFGITNQCEYTGTRAAGNLQTSECHVDSEGSAGLDENQHGGSNPSDSSGRLEYFIVKHTGAEVGNGDELNGITFSAVGSNTIVRNLQVYSTFDDGIEMFGGSVSFENVALVYVRDDSIDFDDGWDGTIQNALVIQSETDADHCIEADGIGNFSTLDSATIESIIAQGINTRSVINNLTCLGTPSSTGTHSEGSGWRFREGVFVEINDSLMINSFKAPEGAAGTNYCLRIDNRSQQALLDGDIQFNSVIFACNTPTGGSNAALIRQAVTDNTGAIFANITGAKDPTAAGADTDLQLLEGTTPVFSIDFDTMVVNDAMLTRPPFVRANWNDEPVPGSFNAYIGALSQGDVNWAQGWTFGIFPGSRSQPLWFEAE